MSASKGQQAAQDGGDIQVFDFDPTPDAPVTVEIAVKHGPISGMDISADGSRLLVTNHGDNSVSIVDTDTCRVVQTVAGIEEPFAIAMGPDRAYVSTVSAAYDSIGVIDMATNTVIANHPLALSLSDLTVSPDGKYVYASRNGVRGADVAVLDTVTERVEVIDIATTPGTATECVRVSADGTRLYVGTNGPCGGQLVVLATGAPADDNAGRGGSRSRWRKKSPKSRSKTVQPGLRVLETIQIGASVRDVALSPDDAIAYVASCGDDFSALVDVIDTRSYKIAGTIKIGDIGGLVTRLTIGGSGDRAYVVSEDRVTVLCTLTQDVIGTIKTSRPSCVAESPDGRYLYIADYTGTVTLTPTDASPASENEQPALESSRSVDWFLPELLQYEPALA